MDADIARSPSEVSPSTKWSIYAGAYAFLWGTALVLLLSPVHNTLIQLLGLPTDFSALVMASPAAVIGAIVWWTTVERRNEHTYLLGVVSGLLTAFFTVFFWFLAFVLVWGLSLVLTGGVVIRFVLAASLPVVFVSGLSLMYVRRRLGDRPPDGKERALR